MNKTFFTLMLLLLFALTACTGTNAAANANAVTLTENYTNAISVEEQLIVGTFKLEGTDLAVDSQTASQLLPLWNLLKELKSNGSAADEEVSAVAEQIQSTMSAEQIKAIKDMQLTQNDVAAIFQGQASTAETNTSNGTNSQSPSGNAQTPGGGMYMGDAPPAGSPAGGGFDPGSSPNFSQKNNSASGSTSSTQSASTMLIDQVIKLLESKVQG
ncbi:MAG: hypothetical protein HY258_09735 [Chloroflexi bacterium]|nr:hypothetical protein [Chloroflexota bacterium]